MNQHLNVFLKEIEHHSYSEKYKRWEDYLSMESQSDNYLHLLAIFLQYFPFNCKYWMQYIELTKFEEYQTALLRNPKSFQLWASYLQNYKLLEKDTQKYRAELKKATDQVGSDARALFLYEEYYESLATEPARFEFYKKIFTRGLINLEAMFGKFEEWFALLNDQQINIFAVKELKEAASKLTPQQQKNHLYQLISSIYQKTLTYRQLKLKLEEQIKHYYYNGSEENLNQNQQWKQLIKLERAYNIVENISYCYQRSLMAQTDDVQLWEDTFHYMQNQTNKYIKVRSILRNNRIFFLNFDTGLYFYWCDLQERQSASAARKMYEQLVKINNTYEIYKRWIQFQIRQKQYHTVRSLYDGLLVIFQAELQILSYILVEYSQFVVKYYKDFDYAKKLLKAYFEHLSYNQYLLVKYLEFIKNFENKEGYYEELMQIISQAITKAFKVLKPEQYSALTKMIKYYLRSTLNSIYLIKISEQKMLETEEKLNKQSKMEMIAE